VGVNVRLQKFLAEAGVASRRAGEQIILEGRVAVSGTVDGVPFTVRLVPEAPASEADVRTRLVQGRRKMALAG